MTRGARAVGMDDFISGSGGLSAQLPMASAANWGVLFERDGEWFERSNFWMITEFFFADGRVWGNGYMETSATERPDRVYRLDGDLEVRETYTVTGGDRVVSEVSFRAAREGGSAPVQVTLREEGEVMWSGTLASSAYPTVSAGSNPSRDATFASVAIEPPLTLREGRRYDLEMRTSAGTVYAVPAMRDGSANGWFTPQTTFSDGHAELREGGGEWTGWTTWSTEDTEAQDLSFYFGVVR